MTEAHSCRTARKACAKAVRKTALAVLGLSFLLSSGTAIAGTLPVSETAKTDFTLPLNETGGYPRLFLGVYDNFYAAVPDLLWIGAGRDDYQLPGLKTGAPGAGNLMDEFVVSM